MLPGWPYPNRLLTQLLEKCGDIRTAWKARHSQPNQPPGLSFLSVGPPNIPPTTLAQQRPLPPSHPQPSHSNPQPSHSNSQSSHSNLQPSHSNPHPHPPPRDHQPQQQHSFSQAQTGVQGGVVRTPPWTGAGPPLPNGEVRYGPLQVSRWSRVTGPAMWGGMYR